MANLTKKQRQAIHAKYDGHCAYCGKVIAYKEMQVDHMIPQRRATYKAGKYRLPVESIENFENYYPACRRCNHYKRAHSLETFRRYIEEIPEKLAANYIYKVGADYGLVEYHPKKIQFYFEKYEEIIDQLDIDNIQVCEIEDSDLSEMGVF